MTPIVQELADTDVYKETMRQAGMTQFPGTMARTVFQCRSKVDLRPFADEIREEINHLAEIRFAPDDLRFLGSKPYMKQGHIAYLKNFRLDPQAYVTTRKGEENLEIEACGPWADITPFEIHVLEIVAEVYHRNVNGKADLNAAEKTLLNKIHLLRKTVSADARGRIFRLIEFGTRRRYSRVWQRRVLEILMEEIPTYMWGTSNIRLAREFNLRVVGTMAHEWLQLGQATDVRLSESQKRAFEAWVAEYRGDLGIALTDIFGIKAFIADFDLYFAKLFDGVRHDSGDPFAWSEQILAMYRGYNIRPETKAAVYSDGLDMPKALKLWDAYEGQLMTSYGMGTNLTCDIPGVEALQIVMKPTDYNGQPVAKLSDSPGKTICKDPEFLAYLASTIARKLKGTR